MSGGISMTLRSVRNGVAKGTATMACAVALGGSVTTAVAGYTGTQDVGWNRVVLFAAPHLADVGWNSLDDVGWNSFGTEDVGWNRMVAAPKSGTEDVGWNSVLAAPLSHTADVGWNALAA
ncbi:hypothetical protein [Streptomyces sp. NPDC006879]|uniref:hypothetical protein n=1 Tax=Streptomyces sp. NPDC006879 TaxID=3364767 RepID=UPI0036C624AC